MQPEQPQPNDATVESGQYDDLFEGEDDDDLPASGDVAPSAQPSSRKRPRSSSLTEVEPRKKLLPLVLPEPSATAPATAADREATPDSDQRRARPPPLILPGPAASSSNTVSADQADPKSSNFSSEVQPAPPSSGATVVGQRPQRTPTGGPHLSTTSPTSPFLGTPAGKGTFTLNENAILGDFNWDDLFPAQEPPVSAQSRGKPGDTSEILASAKSCTDGPSTSAAPAPAPTINVTAQTVGRTPLASLDAAVPESQRRDAGNGDVATAEVDGGSGRAAGVGGGVGTSAAIAPAPVSPRTKTAADAPSAADSFLAQWWPSFDFEKAFPVSSASHSVPSVAPTPGPSRGPIAASATAQAPAQAPARARSTMSGPSASTSQSTSELKRSHPKSTIAPVQRPALNHAATLSQLDQLRPRDAAAEIPRPSSAAPTTRTSRESAHLPRRPPSLHPRAVQGRRPGNVAAGGDVGQASGSQSPSRGGTPNGVVPRERRGAVAMPSPLVPGETELRASSTAPRPAPASTHLGGVGGGLSLTSAGASNPSTMRRSGSMGRVFREDVAHIEPDLMDRARRLFLATPGVSKAQRHAPNSASTVVSDVATTRFESFCAARGLPVAPPHHLLVMLYLGGIETPRLNPTARAERPWLSSSDPDQRKDMYLAFRHLDRMYSDTESVLAFRQHGGVKLKESKTLKLWLAGKSWTESWRDELVKCEALVLSSVPAPQPGSVLLSAHPLSTSHPPAPSFAGQAPRPALSTGIAGYSDQSSTFSSSLAVAPSPQSHTAPSTIGSTVVQTLNALNMSRGPMSQVDAGSAHRAGSATLQLIGSEGGAAISVSSTPRSWLRVAGTSTPAASTQAGYSSNTDWIFRIEDVAVLKRYQMQARAAVRIYSTASGVEDAIKRLHQRLADLSRPDNHHACEIINSYVQNLTQILNVPPWPVDIVKVTLWFLHGSMPARYYEEVLGVLEHCRRRQEESFNRYTGFSEKAVALFRTRLDSHPLKKSLDGAVAAMRGRDTQ